MANTDLATRNGLCINSGQCSKAIPTGAKKLKNYVINVNFGDEFICPECECGLIDAPKTGGGFPPALKWILIIVGILTVLGTVGYFGYKFFSKNIGDVEPLKAPSLVLDVDDTTGRLIATILPNEISENNKKIIWQSSDEAVATVDEKGVVTANANGSTIISVYTLNGLSATCYVTVDSDSSGVNGNSSSSGGSGSGKSGGSGGIISVPGGTYSGEIKNGQPDGMGTIRYNSRTLIDSRDMKKRYAEAGQSITGQFRNGRLLQGKLFDNNGNQIEAIIIGGGAH